MIFYLSCTGNTKWAARQIASATDEELLYMPRVSSDTVFCPSEGERIGFCFPVHGWRPPTLVRNFVRQLQMLDSESHYCYMLCTAGDNIGETADIFEQDLRQIGLHLDSAFSLIMPESYVGLPFMDVDKPEKEQEKKRVAQSELNEYIGHIIARDVGEKRLVVGKWPRINSEVIGTVFERYLITDKHFHVDTAKCTACGLCASLCPTDDILGGKGKMPEWLHNGKCLTCFSCYHHCPQKAISFGNRTRNKGQYFFERTHTEHKE